MLVAAPVVIAGCSPAESAECQGADAASGINVSFDLPDPAQPFTIETCVGHDCTVREFPEGASEGTSSWFVPSPEIDSVHTVAVSATFERDDELIGGPTLENLQPEKVSVPGCPDGFQVDLEVDAAS